LKQDRRSTIVIASHFPSALYAVIHTVSVNFHSLFDVACTAQKYSVYRCIDTTDTIINI